MLALASVLVNTIRLYGMKLTIVDAEVSFIWSEYGPSISQMAACCVVSASRRGRALLVFAAITVGRGESFDAGYWGGAIPVPINKAFCVQKCPKRGSGSKAESTRGELTHPKG